MNKNLIELVLEKVTTKIPAELQKLIKSKQWRKEQLRKYGAAVFLDPTALKFPVKVDGKYDCRLIHAAILHATMYSKKGSSVNDATYYQGIASAAKKVYATNKCENEVGVKINESDDFELGASDILEIYTMDCLTEMQHIVDDETTKEDSAEKKSKKKESSEKVKTLKKLLSKKKLKADGDKKEDTDKDKQNEKAEGDK